MKYSKHLCRKSIEKSRIKLDHSRDKAGRCDGHLLFLSHYISKKVILNSLKIEHEPTTGNHDEGFLSNWFNKLQQYPFYVVKNVVTFCY